MGARISAVEDVFVSCLTGAAESLFATLFPSDCRLCGAPLVKISRLPVCEDCLSAVRPIAGGLCSICGEAIVSPYATLDSQGEILCGLCRRSKPPYLKAVAYGSYEGGLRDLLHLLKYDRVRPAARVLGRMLAEVITRLAPDFGDESPLLVPVPLHERKLRERGFNQSALIAEAALKLNPAGLALPLASAVLQRTRATQSQTGLSSHQRRENVRGAFIVTHAAEVAGRSVLLVDDVFTTGTTVSECARQLRRAGAARVWVATVARTLKVSATHADFASHEDGVEVTAMAAHV